MSSIIAGSERLQLKGKGDEKMALLIDRKGVEQLLTMKDAVEAVEEGFRAMGEEPLLNHPRRRLHWRPGDARKLNIFAGSLPEAGYIGVLARFDYPNRP